MHAAGRLCKLAYAWSMWGFFYRHSVCLREGARQNLCAWQAAEARDAGRVRGEEDRAVAQLPPRGCQQVAQVPLVGAALPVLVLHLQHTHPWHSDLTIGLALGLRLGLG